MRIHQLSNNELRELLKAEQARFKELDERRKATWENTDLTTQPLSEYMQAWEQLKADWKDSAEQIAYLYKKLHPYFPVGTCPHCGSVTSKIVGSGRNHYACVACGEETIS